MTEKQPLPNTSKFKSPRLLLISQILQWCINTSRPTRQKCLAAFELDNHIVNEAIDRLIAGGHLEETTDGLSSIDLGFATQLKASMDSWYSDKLERLHD